MRSTSAMPRKTDSKRVRIFHKIAVLSVMAGAGASVGSPFIRAVLIVLWY